MAWLLDTDKSRRKLRAALYTKKELERLYTISLHRWPDFTLTELMRIGMKKPSLPKYFANKIAPYLQPEEIHAIYGPLRNIPKLINKTAILSVIARWRLEIGH